MKHPTMKMKSKVVAKKSSYRPPIIKRQEKVEDKKQKSLTLAMKKAAKLAKQKQNPKFCKLKTKKQM